MSTSRMVRHIRLQASFCAQIGSPLYAELLERVADDVEQSGPSADVLSGHEQDPGPSALALRLMGSVHRLVLDGRAPELARRYPSVGGDGDPAAAWPALRKVLHTHRDELHRLVERPVQTNDVGRAAVLAGGLAHVAAWRETPVRLLEIGASGGLNLRVDALRIEAGDGSGVGPADSPVVLRNAWRGALPPMALPKIVHREGCDPAPVDPTTRDGWLTLASYVWPDQEERVERLRAACEVASQLPAPVVAQSAESFVRRQELVPGTTTVLWHSVMWQYLGTDEQAAVEESLARLAASADESAGLARLSMEPERRHPGAEHEFLVRLRTWPGGRDVVLGVAGPHGLPVTWE